MAEKGWTKSSHSPRNLQTSQRVSSLFGSTKAQKRKQHIKAKHGAGGVLHIPGGNGQLDLIESPKKSASGNRRTAIPTADVRGLRPSSSAMLRDAAVKMRSSISPRHKKPVSSNVSPPIAMTRRRKSAPGSVVVLSDSDDTESHSDGAVDLCADDTDDDDFLAEGLGTPGLNVVRATSKRKLGITPQKLTTFPVKKLEKVAPKVPSTPAPTTFNVLGVVMGSASSKVRSTIQFKNGIIKAPGPSNTAALIYLDDVKRLLWYSKLATKRDFCVLSIKFDPTRSFLKGYEAGAYLSLVTEMDMQATLITLELDEGVLKIIPCLENNIDPDFSLCKKVIARYDVLATVQQRKQAQKRTTSVKGGNLWDTDATATYGRKHTQSRLAVLNDRSKGSSVAIVRPRVKLKLMDVLTWPPPPSKGAITISTGDLMRLQDGEFLNDQVIDFYLKYVALQYPREDTHIFNSHFYKRGSQKPKDVLRWTKGTNIFKKSYLLVPVHDHAHWLLAIVCYPGGAIEGQPLNTSDAITDEELASIHNETRILFFDSLSTSTTTAARRIRQFLDEIWKKDHADTPRSFSNVPACQVDVPQQDNSSDCGVFVMHFAELFLQSPSPQPESYGSGWFRVSTIHSKRREFLQLIQKLATEQGLTLDKDVSDFLSGTYAAATPASQQSDDLSVVDTVEQDGVIMLADTDTDGDVEMSDADGSEPILKKRPRDEGSDEITPIKRSVFLAPASDKPFRKRPRPRALDDSDSEELDKRLDEFAAELFDDL